MKLIIVPFCAVVLAASNFAFSQNITKPPRDVQWRGEPTSVFGIKLGEKLLGEVVAPCGGTVGKDVDPIITVCAMHRPGATGISIAGFPVNEFQSGNVLLRDDIVTAIWIEARHRNYISIKLLLMDRYGTPTMSTSQVMQNKFGASFSSEKHTWSGKNITLTLDERAGSVDETMIFFSHNKSSEKSQQEAEQKRKTDAAKM